MNYPSTVWSGLRKVPPNGTHTSFNIWNPFWYNHRATALDVSSYLCTVGLRTGPERPVLPGLFGRGLQTGHTLGWPSCSLPQTCRWLLSTLHAEPQESQQLDRALPQLCWCSTIRSKQYYARMSFQAQSRQCLQVHASTGCFSESDALWLLLA